MINNPDDKELASESSFGEMRMRSAAAIPSVLAAAVEGARKGDKVIGRYLSRVLCHTLHCQVNPRVLIRLVESVENLSAKKYILNWRSSTDCATLGKPFHADESMCKLTRFLNSEDEESIAFLGKQLMRIFE